MGPFKCPDCGVWWAGFEHRCPSSPQTTTTANGGFCVTCRCWWIRSHYCTSSVGRSRYDIDHGGTGIPTHMTFAQEAI